MALENLVGPDKFLSALVAANPTGGDDKREGDDHIRGVKNVILNTFPNINGAVTMTDEELNSVTAKVNRAGDTMSGNLTVSANVAASVVLSTYGVVSGPSRLGIRAPAPWVPNASGDLNLGIAVPSLSNVPGFLAMFSGAHGSTGIAWSRIIHAAVRVNNGAEPDIVQTQIAPIGDTQPSVNLYVSGGSVWVNCANSGGGVVNILILGLVE